MTRHITLHPGTIKRIVVNKHVIKFNNKNNTNKPPLSVQTSNGPIYGHEIEIEDAIVFKYNRNKPLKCGATVWAETHSRVFITLKEDE
jgi:hypothetical protein